MIISEKQIMLLISGMHTFMAILDAKPEKALTMLSQAQVVGSSIANLLGDITLQQSNELKEIE